MPLTLHIHSLFLAELPAHLLDFLGETTLDVLGRDDLGSRRSRPRSDGGDERCTSSYILLPP